MTQLDDIIKGDTYSRQLNITQEYEGVETAVDLTGKTVYFTVKQNEDDTDANAIVNKTITSHANPTGGVTAIDLTDDETRAINVGTYVYDVKLYDGATVTTLLIGNVNVLETVRKTVG